MKLVKLKPIAASLLLLAVAAPAFADDSASSQAQLDQMKAQINKMQAVINQNSATGFQQPADWMSRITLSGLLNVDGTYGNRPPIGFGSGSVSNIAVNNANLLADAAVNDWTNVHINILDQSNLSSAITPPGVMNQTGDDGIAFDEAYVTLGNFAVTPIYFRAGKEYLPFGVYNRYPMVENPTQLLTETQGTAAQLGFVSSMGIYGSAYALRGLPTNNEQPQTFTANTTANGIPVTASGTTSGNPRVQNYGFDLGYVYCDPNWSTHLDAGYLRNMVDVNDVAAGLTSYQSQVGALSLSAGFTVQQFDIKGDYVTALQDFSNTNLNGDGYSALGGEKPQAWGIEAGYSFPVTVSGCNHASRLAVGYQKTKDSQYVGSSMNAVVTPDSVNVNDIDGIGLPKNRWYGLYTIDVSKWTNVGLEVYRDQAYSTSNGGTGQNATVGVVRLGVKFA